MRHRVRSIGLIAVALFACRARAQNAPPAPAPPPASEERGRVFHDSLLQQLTGDWTMTGAVKGKPVTYGFRAEWVLQHTWFRLEMQDVAEPPQYQAIVYIGYDDDSARYVAHWIDVFGGRFSETLGYGRREGNVVRFEFKYPDGPFYTSFLLDPAAGTWRVEMKDRLPDGSWRDFARYRLDRH
jgi:hypothetical protein